jgi:hypothetical protein
MRWIGLTGKMGAGKDHTFKALQAIEPRAYRISFADQLRFEVEEFLNQGEPLDVLWSKPYSEPVRRLLQWWGTDFRRAENPNYWVEKAEQQAHWADMDGKLPVFTDARFPNEADMIVRNGGIIVRVLAPTEVRTQRLGQLPPEHLSETAMDEYAADMHITSLKENPVYSGVVQRILYESTVDDVVTRIQSALDRD